MRTIDINGSARLGALPPLTKNVSLTLILGALITAERTAMGVALAFTTILRIIEETFGLRSKSSHPYTSTKTSILGGASCVLDTFRAVDKTQVRATLRVNSICDPFTTIYAIANVGLRAAVAVVCAALRRCIFTTDC
jgi:hypothetical protein